MNLKICFAILGIGILIGAILYLLRKKNLGLSGATTETVPKSAQIDSGKLNWLDENIHSYEKKYCGYLIENERIEKGISISQIKELQDKYGVVLVKPTFTLAVDFYEKYPDDKRSVLMDTIYQWLKNAGETVKTNDLLEAIEKKAIQNATEEFNKVFEFVIDTAT